jgi:hypothetical protein
MHGLLPCRPQRLLNHRNTREHATAANIYRRLDPSSYAAVNTDRASPVSSFIHRPWIIEDPVHFSRNLSPTGVVITRTRHSTHPTTHRCAITLR